MKRSGWTLVETLVSLGIFSLLLGIFLPAVQNVRESAARAKCLDRMRQIGVALHGYEGLHGRLPPRVALRPGFPAPEAALSWMALILPQIGEPALYGESVRACTLDPDPMHNPPHVGFATTVNGYVCPDDPITAPQTDRWGRTVSFTSYLGVSGAALPGRRRTSAGVFGSFPGCKVTDITDGTSSTLMVGERPPPASLQAGWWYPIMGLQGVGLIGPNNYVTFGEYISAQGDPECKANLHFFGPGQADNPCDRYHFWSYHPGGGNWLFADASVRFLQYSADPLMPALATRAGGEPVTVPD